MYGAIIGDIAGSPYEFCDTKRYCMKDKLDLAKGECTDDTVMTLAVADTLLNDYDPWASDNSFKWALARNLRRWGDLYPNAGYGGTFYRWLNDPDFGPYNSYGNGSAMRVSPVGWMFPTMWETRHMARLTAEVTHTHPEGIKGAEAVAAAIFLARNGKSKEEIKRYIETEFDYRLDRTDEEIRKSERHTVSCMDTVPEAICAFLHGTTYINIVKRAVSYGGDTDTLAAIAGSIAEAMYGIPEKLKKECQEEHLDGRMLKTIQLFEAFLSREEENHAQQERVGAMHDMAPEQDRGKRHA